MQNKNQIKDKFELALNSTLWQGLKASLIGKELIAWATELVYATELVNNSLGNSLYIDEATIDNINVAANAAEVAIQKIKPASIKIKVNSGSVVYYPPYTLKLTIGSISFTNVDYVSSENVIELYQGNVTTMFSNGVQTTFDFMSFKVDSTIPWQIHTEYTESEYYSKYVKLSANALAHSVRVFSKNGSLVLPLTHFNPLIADETNPLVKVRMGWDKIVSVIFGNGLWGKPIETNDHTYQVLWLELTQKNFDPTVTVLKYWPQGSTSGTVVSHSVLSHSNSSDEDIVWIRNYIKAELAKHTQIGTKQQIRNFAKKYSSVIDCSVVRSEVYTNRINIYIKPKVTTDTIFTDIEDALTLYGEPVIDYRAIKGNPFLFTILLSSADIIDPTIKSAIVAFLQSQYAYEVLEYNKQLNTSEIVSSLSSFTNVSIIANLQVTEILSDEKRLSFLPKPSSIILLVNGNVVGWDVAGLLYSSTQSSPVSFKDVIGSGDFILAATSSNNTITDGFQVITPKSLLTVNVDTALENLNPNTYSRILSVHTNKNYIGYAIQLLHTKDGIPTGKYKIVVYNNDASFKDGEYSIQRYANSLKPVVLDTIFDSNEFQFFDPKNIIIIGKELYNVAIVGTLFIVQKWYYSSGWNQLYYDIQATVAPNTKICGVVEQDGSLFIITNQPFQHLVVENYDTDPVLNKGLFFDQIGLAETLFNVNTYQSSVNRIKDKIHYEYNIAPTNIVFEDLMVFKTLQEMFGSETSPVPTNTYVAVNMFYQNVVRVKISGDYIANNGFTVDANIIVGGQTWNASSYSVYTVETFPDYPKDVFLTFSNFNSVVTDLIIRIIVTLTATQKVSFHHVDLSFSDGNTFTTELAISDLFYFDKVANSIVVNNIKPIFTDLVKVVFMPTVPLTIYNDIIYSKFRILIGVNTFLVIAAYNTVTDSTVYYIKDGETLASDSFSELNSIQQIGTVDYVTGFIALLVSINYTFKYKVQGSSFSIDKSNYPQLDTVIWE